MKYSLDGGMNWFVDSELTDLVTQHGDFRFKQQVRAISFDPHYHNHILVGTEDAGIFRSLRRRRIVVPHRLFKGSCQSTSFFFIENNSREPNDTVIVSHLGRGLWKLIASTGSLRCGRGPEISSATGGDPERVPFNLPEEQQAPLPPGCGTPSPVRPTKTCS